MRNRKIVKGTDTKESLRSQLDAVNLNMEKAICYVPRTGDLVSFHSNGVTVYINAQWAVISRMGIRTVYSSTTNHYQLINYIYSLYAKDQESCELDEEESSALMSGLVFIQSLVISDYYPNDLDFAFVSVENYLDKISMELDKIDEVMLPADNLDDLNQMNMSSSIVSKLKNDL